MKTLKVDIIKTDRFINYYLYESNPEVLENYSVVNGFTFYYDSKYCYQWVNSKLRDKFYSKRLEYGK